MLERRVPISFQTLTGILRCAHKYQADKALEHTRARFLEVLYPYAVNISHISARLEGRDTTKSIRRPTAPDMEINDAIEAVLLLRLLDPDVKDTDTRPLSWALYMCTLCDPIALRNGYARMGTEDTFRLSAETKCITCSF